jgi:cytochrome b
VVGDPYSGISPLAVFVPGVAEKLTVPVTLGTFALYGLVSLGLATYLADRIPKAVWRAIHATAFGTYLLALAHGVLAGSETQLLAVRALYIGTAAVLVCRRRAARVAQPPSLNLENRTCIMKRILVWDLPTRLFHWLLAGSFVAAFAIANVVDDDSSTFAVHMLLGAVMGLMVVLRVLWGFVGSRYARFGSFAFGPGDVLAYLKGTVSGEGKRYIGHNPGSSVAIWAMLGLTLGLGVSGALMSTNEALEEVHEVLAYALLASRGDSRGGRHLAHPASPREHHRQHGDWPQGR